MCLTDVSRGDELRIERIEGGLLRAQLIRFGITEGSAVRCLEKIPLGPVMLQLNRQEIAVGREAARRIFVGRRGSP